MNIIAVGIWILDLFIWKPVIWFICEWKQRCDVTL